MIVFKCSIFISNNYYYYENSTENMPSKLYNISLFKVIIKVDEQNFQLSSFNVKIN